MQVTSTYVWVEYTSPSTGAYHNTKFRRIISIVDSQGKLL
jgi:hypothetical protein